MHLSCFFSPYGLGINPGEVRWFADTFPFCRENFFFPILPFHLVDYLIYCTEAFYFEIFSVVFVSVILSG